MAASTKLGETNNGSTKAFGAADQSFALFRYSGASAMRHSSVMFCGLPMTAGFTQADALRHTFEASPSEDPVLTTFINPLAFHMAQQDKGYAGSLAHFDLVLPDGIGIVLGLRLIGDLCTERLSFDSTSLALPVLRRAGLEGRSVMLIGGIPGVCLRAKERLTEAIPSLRISGFMDGFRSFQEYEAEVSRARPDIIICGMGAPRQEELLLKLKEVRAWNGLGFTCGGYLDQLQQGLHYYPAAVDKLDLRWLYRLVKEPRRLLRRYTLEYRVYWSALMRELLHRGVRSL